MNEATTPAADDYFTAFYRETQEKYPILDAFEQGLGYAIPEIKIQTAAMILACPVKVNPPNWQHGRVLYAVAREYLKRSPSRDLRMLDIGTAKGFSALCLALALEHAVAAHEHPPAGDIYSVDVIDPAARVRRNTVAEVYGLKTLDEILEPWEPHLRRVHFSQSTGIEWLERHPERVGVAFVDGKHDGHTVIREGRLLAARQEPGDMVVFDDVHIPSVSQAVHGLEGDYRVTVIQLLRNRHYAVATRR